MRKKAFHNPTHAYMAGKLMPKSELILKTTATHTKKQGKLSVMVTTVTMIMTKYD